MRELPRGADHAIEVLLLPDLAPSYLMCCVRLPGVQNLGNGVAEPDVDHYVDVVRHDGPCVQVVAFAVEVLQRTSNKAGMLSEEA